jgi:hypothetical protein
VTRAGRSLVAVVVLSVLLTACTRSGGGPAGSPESSGAGASGGDRSGAIAALATVFGQDVTPRSDGAFGLDRWMLVDGGAPVPGGRALRVQYPRGSVSPAASREYGSPGGGMQVFLLVNGKAQDDAYLRYWVRFPPNFEFVKGGKLPGLFGGSEVSGGEHPDGTNGFSTRLMWRSNGAGEVYLYAPHESGTSLGRGSWTWPRGEWTCVEEHVTLNKPGAHDGAVTVWVDGNEVLTEQKILYRSVDRLRIEGIFFSTFFGGADPSWAPHHDQHADFAGFALSGQPIGCNAG